jgi:hypothetical protein
VCVSVAFLENLTLGAPAFTCLDKKTGKTAWSVQGACLHVQFLLSFSHSAMPHDDGTRWRPLATATWLWRGCRKNGTTTPWLWRCSLAIAWSPLTGSSSKWRSIWARIPPVRAIATFARRMACCLPCTHCADCLAHDRSPPSH